MNFEMGPEAELMFQQAYWNDKRVYALDNGMITNTGIARVYFDEYQKKIVANIRTDSGAWIRGVPLKRLKLVNPEEG